MTQLFKGPAWQNRWSRCALICYLALIPVAIAHGVLLSLAPAFTSITVSIGLPLYIGMRILLYLAERQRDRSVSKRTCLRSIRIRREVKNER